MRRSARLALILATLGALIGSECVAQQTSSYFVLGVEGPVTVDEKSVLWGTAVNAEAVLKLPPKTSLTLLGEKGKIVLRGLLEGALTELQHLRTISSNPSTGLLSSLLMRANLFTQRNGSVENTSGDLWTIRIDTPGTKCIQTGKAPSLAWDSAFNGRHVTIENPARDAYARVALGAGATQWPAAIPVTTSSEYRVSIDGTGVVVGWKLADAAPSPDALDTTLQGMERHGCVEQLLSYAAGLPIAAVISGQ